MTSDYETRKAALQLDAAISAIRNKGLGSHTNHFLAGVAFALQSPHRGPRVLNALHSDFDRSKVAEKIRGVVIDAIAKAGNPPIEEVVDVAQEEAEAVCCEEEEEDDECCTLPSDDDNFCSKCGAEL